MLRRIDVVGVGYYTATMSQPSEAEAAMGDQMEQVLQALPVVRRWLLRSMPVRQSGQNPSPVPLSHVRVLIHLHQNGSMCMGDLARGLGIACSTATECVAGLEARGRVTRDRSLADRRQVVVQLTPEAEAVASQVLSQRRVVIERALRKLSPGEGRAFVKGMALLAAEAESWMEQDSSLERAAPVAARRV